MFDTSHWTLKQTLSYSRVRLHDKPAEKCENHPWQALCIHLLLLVNISIAVQVIGNEKLQLKEQHEEKKEQNVQQKRQSNKNNSINIVLQQKGLKHV